MNIKLKKHSLKLALLAALMGTAFSAYAVGNFMSFGIAAGGYNYTILEFNKGGGDTKCYAYNGGSTDKKIPAGAHIMCNIYLDDIGPDKFSMTIQRDQTDMKCTVVTNKEQVKNDNGDEDENGSEDTITYKVSVTTEDCNIPGVVIVDQDPDHKKFEYGDQQVNLQ